MMKSYECQSDLANKHVARGGVLVLMLVLSSACEKTIATATTTGAGGEGGRATSTGGAGGAGGAGDLFKDAGLASSDSGAPPEGMFVCDQDSALFCKKGVTYCVTATPGVCCSGVSHACVPLPDTCTPGADCSCLDKQCGSPTMCSQIADGEFAILCTGV